MLPRPASRHTPHLAGALLALALAAGTAGCSSTAGHPATSSRPPEPAPSTVTPAPVTLDEHAGGTTVHLHTGTAVVIRLHSTYWSFSASSDPRILAPTGGGGVSHSPTCPPGGGCGESSAHFIAGRPGTAHITAHRTSCGEAMRCPPGRGSYDVTVAVTG